MFAWWIALSPTVRRWIVWGLLACAVGLVIFWSIRYYGVAQWRRGEQAGRVAGADDLMKKMEKEWRDRLKTLDSQREQLAIDSAALSAQRDELRKQRQMADATLAAALKAIQNAQDANHGTVINIPADKLDDAIRGFLADYLKSAVIK